MPDNGKENYLISWVAFFSDFAENSGVTGITSFARWHGAPSGGCACCVRCLVFPAALHLP